MYCQLVLCVFMYLFCEILAANSFPCGNNTVTFNLWYLSTEERLGFYDANNGWGYNKPSIIDLFEPMKMLLLMAHGSVTHVFGFMKPRSHITNLYRLRFSWLCRRWGHRGPASPQTPRRWRRNGPRPTGLEPDADHRVLPGGLPEEWSGFPVLRLAGSTNQK